MRHYAITLPNDDELGAVMVAALDRGILSGAVIPHNLTDANADVSAGSVLEFDTDNAELMGILEKTARANPPGFKLVYVEVDGQHDGVHHV